MFDQGPGNSFLSFLSQSIHLLEEDESLYCISAWNDQVGQGRMVGQGHLCPVLFPCQAGIQVPSLKQGVPPAVILSESVSPALDCSEVSLQITVLSLSCASQWLSPVPHAEILNGARRLLFWWSRGAFRVLNAPCNIAGL